MWQFFLIYKGKSALIKLILPIFHYLASVMKDLSEKIAPGFDFKKAKELKKDRHIKCLGEFNQFIEKINESVVQEVLLLSRDIREELEIVDENLDKYLKSIAKDDFLLNILEKDLLDIRSTLHQKYASRLGLIDNYAANLDKTEIRRTDEVSKHILCSMVTLFKRYAVILRLGKS